MGSKLLEKLGIRTDATVEKAEESLDQIQEHVREAWREQTRNAVSGEYRSWVMETYPDHVIVCVGDEYFSVPYSSTDDGISFDFDAATAVERTWSEVEKTVVIEKIDDERRVAFGWAYVYEQDGEQVVDHSGEFVDKSTPEVLEDAAYVFNLVSRAGDDSHTETVKAQLVESFVSTPEKLEKMGLEPDALPHGWWTGWHVEDDELWNAIKTGDRPMLSIGGTAKKEAVDA